MLRKIRSQVDTAAFLLTLCLKEEIKLDRLDLILDLLKAATDNLDDLIRKEEHEHGR